MGRYKRKTPANPWDSQAELDLLRHFCRQDFWTFFLYAFGAGINPKGRKWIDDVVHEPLAMWFQKHVLAWEADRKKAHDEGSEPQQRHLAVVVPRELGKTTMGQALQLWLHLRDPETSSYTGSERLDLSQKILGGIKAVLDGSDPYALFTKLYGNWATQARSWTGKEVTHAARKNTSRKDPSFGTFAVETSIVGAHPDVWIEDDPNSYERMSSDTNWLQTVNSQVSSMVPVIQADGLIIWLGCIEVGSPVLMSNGTWKAIETVEVGDSVYTTDETGGAAVRTVEASLDQGTGPTVRVTTKSGSLRCTPWHPFLVAKGGSLAWVRADALRKSDLVVTLKSAPSDPTLPWMTKDLAWLCGVIMGDGWIGKNADYACIAMSKHEDLNERITSVLEDWIPNSEFHRTAFGYLRCNSRAAAEAFRTLGLVGGAKTKRVPDWVYRETAEHRVAFLKGFCEADGCKNKRGDDSWRTEIANSDLTNDLRLLARTCGVRVGKEGCVRERWIKAPNSRDPVLSKTVSSNFNFATVGYQERPDTYGGNRAYGFETASARKLGETFRLDRVVSVEPAGECQVWDLTVEGSRSFVCNGYVVHNTRYDDDDHFGIAFREEGVATLEGMETDSIMVDPELGKWHVYFLAARGKDDKPIAPKVWPEVRLAAYQRRDPLRYAAQVMNDPAISEHNPITRDQIAQCGVSPQDVPWNSLRFAITFDTAFAHGEKRLSKDDTVFIIHGYPRNGSGDVYVCEVHGSSEWRAEDFFKRVVAKVQQYRGQGRKVFALAGDFFASGGRAGTMEPAFRNYFHDVGEPMPQLYEFNRNVKGQDKITRMVNAANFWVDGHVRWVKGAPGIEKLTEQMAKIGQMMVNRKAKDDYVDAHADAFQPELYAPMRRFSKPKPPWEPGSEVARTPGLDLDEFSDRWGEEVARAPLQPLR